MSHPVKLRLSDDLERTRVTVLFRLVLAIPLAVWLYLWGLAVVVMTILNWFATLATGTPWREAHAFASRYVRYTVHVYAYVALLADPYPGFGGHAGYPVDVELPEPGPQNRWTVLFRLVLALPALLLGGVLSTGLSYGGASVDSYYQLVGLLTVVALLGWFAILARSRMPRGLRDAGAYAVAYSAQLYAYLLLLTDRYPNSDPLAALDDLPVRGDDPIRLDVEDDRKRGRATTFFRLLLAFPHFVWLVLWGIAAYGATVASWFFQLVAGRPHGACTASSRPGCATAPTSTHTPTCSPSRTPSSTGERGRTPSSCRWRDRGARTG